MLAKVHSAQVIGLRADIIDVEVDIAKGLHSFSIVGLPDKAVEEARDRIAAAIKNSGFSSPQKSSRKVIVSLAPADIKKEGPIFDLAIAISYLLAGRELNFSTAGKLFIGELALDGSLRPIRGSLMIAQEAKRAGFTELYLPRPNATEAALVQGLRVYACTSLKQIAEHLLATENAEPVLQAEEPTTITPAEVAAAIDFAEVAGQETAKRGLEIAAAGAHNIALSGPPGTGKTMLAKAFAGILPPLSFEEALEITGIHSAAGILAENLITRPPFRSPHHTASYVSLVGGGAWPRPGEITLAHGGVLFLDEFPEFEKRVIESLRQPLEDRVITVSRARGSILFPANFILVAAMNPCPCGHRGTRGKVCVCSPSALARYERKISGPIVDRIDLWLEVPPVDHEKLSLANRKGESSAAIRQRIQTARERQRRRFQQAGLRLTANSAMSVRDLPRFAPLAPAALDLLNNSAKKLDLSARAYHRVIKLARTIADLEGGEDISENHLLEALQYRPRNLY